MKEKQIFYPVVIIFFDGLEKYILDDLKAYFDIIGLSPYIYFIKHDGKEDGDKKDIYNNLINSLRKIPTGKIQNNFLNYDIPQDFYLNIISIANNFYSIGEFLECLKKNGIKVNNATLITYLLFKDNNLPQINKIFSGYDFFFILTNRTGTNDLDNETIIPYLTDLIFLLSTLPENSRRLVLKESLKQEFVILSIGINNFIKPIKSAEVYLVKKLLKDNIKTNDSIPDTFIKLIPSDLTISNKIKNKFCSRCFLPRSWQKKRLNNYIDNLKRDFEKKAKETFESVTFELSMGKWCEKFSLDYKDNFLTTLPHLLTEKILISMLEHIHQHFPLLSLIKSLENNMSSVDKTQEKLTKKIKFMYSPNFDKFKSTFLSTFPFIEILLSVSAIVLIIAVVNLPLTFKIWSSLSLFVTLLGICLIQKYLKSRTLNKFIAHLNSFIKQNFNALILCHNRLILNKIIRNLQSYRSNLRIVEETINRWLPSDETTKKLSAFLDGHYEDLLSFLSNDEEIIHELKKLLISLYETITPHQFFDQLRLALSKKILLWLNNNKELIGHLREERTKRSVLGPFFIKENAVNSTSTFTINFGSKVSGSSDIQLSFLEGQITIYQLTESGNALFKREE